MLRPGCVRTNDGLGFSNAYILSAYFVERHTVLMKITFHINFTFIISISAKRYAVDKTAGSGGIVMRLSASVLALPMLASSRFLPYFLRAEPPPRIRYAA